MSLTSHGHVYKSATVFNCDRLPAVVTKDYGFHGWISEPETFQISFLFEIRQYTFPVIIISLWFDFGVAISVINRKYHVCLA